MKPFFEKLKYHDKKALAALLCAVFVCALLITGGMYMFHKRTLYSPDAEHITSPITSFETLTLRLSGMRSTEEYELTCQGEQTQIALYSYHCSDGSWQRELDNSAVCSTQSVLALFNECKLASWNGFDGPQPKHVSDGTMFLLEASVGEGEHIRAEGSQNFPKHFSEFEDGLQAFLTTEVTP